MVPQPRPDGTEAFSFDTQASVFDRRAGLPSSVSAEIANTLVECSGPVTGRTLLELGAGTGQIGADLASTDLGYIGLDISRPMLVEFRSKVRCSLIQADADAPWPIADSTVDTFFMARSLHLLSTELVAEQVRRVARPGARLVVGGVQRGEGSLRAAMRDRMRSILAAEGIEGRGRGSATKKLFRALRPSLEGLEMLVASTWKVNERPQDSIDSWKGKTGLAGMQIDTAQKERVLSQLETWATQHFGDLESPRISTECYELQILRL